MKYFKLEQWEKEISDAIENDEFVDAPDAEKEKRAPSFSCFIHA